MSMSESLSCRLSALLAGVCGLFLYACDFPRDPEKSWEEASSQALRVGQVSRARGDPVDRREKRIVEEFAREHGLAVRFVEGTESELVGRLERHELHLVFGGVDKKTVWAKRAAISASYDGTHVFLLPKGENRLLYQFESRLFRNASEP